jgi:hypothetical protein
MSEGASVEPRRIWSAKSILTAIREPPVYLDSGLPVPGALRSRSQTPLTAIRYFGVGCGAVLDPGRHVRLRRREFAALLGSAATTWRSPRVRSSRRREWVCWPFTPSSIRHRTERYSGGECQFRLPDLWLRASTRAPS